MVEKELVIEDAGFDNPRPTDWKREDVFGDEAGDGAGQNTKWPQWIKLFNQNLDKRTLKACWGYGITHLHNWEQMNEWKDNGVVFIEEDPKNYRFRFQQLRGWKNIGSSIQEHLDFMRNVERSIEWSVLCNTEDQMKKAIDRGCYIFTGSRLCDRTKTWKTGIFANVWSAPWHLFAIIGYDNKWFIAPNSFGESWGDKWYFHIPYGYKKYLFSCNAIIDSDSTWKLQAYKYELEFKKAIEEGITNWTDPDKPATRKEVAVMVYRWLKKALQN